MWHGEGQIISSEYLVSVSDASGDGVLHQRWQSVLWSEVEKRFEGIWQDQISAFLKLSIPVCLGKSIFSLYPHYGEKIIWAHVVCMYKSYETTCQYYEIYINLLRGRDSVTIVPPALSLPFIKPSIKNALLAVLYGLNWRLWALCGQCLFLPPLCRQYLYIASHTESTKYFPPFLFWKFQTFQKVI